MQYKKMFCQYLPTLSVIFLTLVLVLASVANQRERFQTSLEYEAQLFRKLLAKSEESKINELFAVKSFFESSNYVGRGEFQQFVAPILSHDKSIRALGWVPEISDQDRLVYTNSAKIDGLDAFEFSRWIPSLGWKSQNQAWAVKYYPVYYIYPQTGNEDSLGVDLGSHKERRESINLAISSNQPVATQIVDLAQGGKGFLMLLALQGGNEGAGENSRQNGLVSMAVRVSEFLDLTLATLNSESLQVTMAESRLPKEILYSSVDNSSDGPALQSPFLFLNQQWLLSIRPNQTFIASHRSYESWFVALVGLFSIAMIFLINRRTIEERRRIRGEFETGDRDISIKSALVAFNEVRYQTIIDVLIDAVITMDDKGIIQEFNPAAERMFGFKASEALGQNVKMLMPEPIKQSHDSYLAQYRKTRIPHIIGKGRDVIAQRKNGSTFEARLSVSYYNVAEKLIFVGVLRDTSKEKRLASEQLASSRQLKLILDTTAEGVCGIDSKSVIQFANDSAADMLGFSSQELIGKSFDGFLDNELLNSKLADSQNGSDNLDKTSITVRRKLNSKTDRSISVEINYSPILLDSGEQDGAVVIFRDISERELAEQKTEVQHRKLDQANRDLEQFAYIASHDLKAPLRAIKNLAEWVVEDLGESLQGESLENMNLLQNRVTRLDRLLTDLLEYSRAGWGDHEWLDFNSKQVIRDLVDLQGVPSGFEVRIDEDLPEVYGVRSAFEIVIRNLISNAIKHHDKETGLIQVSMQTVDHEYVFSVSDDGSGIDLDKQEKAFEMFVSLENRKETEGSGMGLAICRRAAEQAGGRVWINADYKTGAQLLFSMPKAIKAD